MGAPLWRWDRIGNLLDRRSLPKTLLRHSLSEQIMNIWIKKARGRCAPAVSETVE
jgi:hypothetical protein